MNITIKKLLVAAMLLLLTSCGAAEVDENSEVTPVVDEQNMDTNYDDSAAGTEDMDVTWTEDVDMWTTDTTDTTDMWTTDDMGAPEMGADSDSDEAISIGWEAN